AAAAGEMIIYARCPAPPAGRETRLPASLPASCLGFGRELAQRPITELFGLELRIAHRYMASRSEDDPAARRQRKYFYRPAIEPILYYNRSELSARLPHSRSLDSFMSCSCARPMVLRYDSS